MSDVCALDLMTKTVVRRGADYVIYRCDYCGALSEEVVTIETGES